MARCACRRSNMPSEHFATTQWSLVRAAGASASLEAQQALERLCATYWFPLYAFARRRTGDADQSQDLTQSFFAQLLEKNTWAVADPARPVPFVSTVGL